MESFAYQEDKCFVCLEGHFDHQEALPGKPGPGAVGALRVRRVLATDGVVRWVWSMEGSVGTIRWVQVGVGPRAWCARDAPARTGTQRDRVEEGLEIIEKQANSVRFSVEIGQIRTDTQGLMCVSKWGVPLV